MTYPDPKTDPGQAAPDPARRASQPGAERQPDPDTNPDHKPLEAPGHDGDRQDPADKRKIEEQPAPDKPAQSMERKATDHEVEVREARKAGGETFDTAPPVATIRTPPD
jgi:hypothetical protein